MLAGEYRFQVIKRQFGYVAVYHRGLAKIIAQISALFVLRSLWMVRTLLLARRKATSAFLSAIPVRIANDDVYK